MCFQEWSRRNRCWKLLCAMGISKSDVTDLYNPKRFVSQANAFGLRAGFAIGCRRMRQGSIGISPQRRTRTCGFLVGSPPCGPFSPLQNLSKGKRTEEQNEAILNEGRTHFKVSVNAYLKQHEGGKFFLHEHPKPSMSWQEPEMKQLEELPAIYKVQSPMCKWKMISEDSQGLGYVRKETQWLINSPEVAKAIQGKCEGGHRHVHWINGRARAAQEYPPRLVSAILKGIENELRNLGELSELSEFNFRTISR